MEITKNACRDNAGKLTYWPLESVVKCGSDIYALEAPAGHDHVSWHELASRRTPLIFAFGEINNKLVSEEDEDVKWINCTATHDLRLAVFGLKTFTIRQRSIPDARWPIIGPLGLIKKGLNAARLSWDGELAKSEDQVECGSVKEDSMKLVEKVPNCVGPGTCPSQCVAPVGKHSLHYIQ